VIFGLTASPEPFGSGDFFVVSGILGAFCTTLQKNSKKQKKLRKTIDKMGKRIV
jgi:hypothetical protein